MNVEYIILGFSIFITLYWLTPSAIKTYMLALTSSIILLCFDSRSFIILLLFSIIIFFIKRFKLSQKNAFLLPVLLIGFSLPLLFFKFKASTSGLFFFDNIVMPLGLSFFTLKLIHYIIEDARGNLEKHTYLEFYNYIFFFPAIAAGPIHRFEEFHTSERRKRWDSLKFGKGMEKILYGACKVIILGNFLVSQKLHNFIVHTKEIHIALRSYLECVEYGLNLYFQFAGYSDIAIGIGLLLGYTISENFSNPFMKPNIVEFWRSWHISLSDWCRNYIFMPVIAYTRRPVLAIILAMLVIGVWHRFTIQFLLWGLYHGAGIVLYHRFQILKDWFFPKINNSLLLKPTYIMAVFINFNFVILGFAITKENSVSSAVQVFKHICLFWI